MKHLFGPVNSRRLGFSQGIDLIPAKICNFSCIYCEVGATTHLTSERKEYIPTAEILTEIDMLLERKDIDSVLDIFTITGSGEPTLHSGIGSVIRYLKARTDKPVAVLTNGSLFHLKDVRDDLMEADIVIPSLDAARPESLRKINRPASDVDLDKLINGLRIFRKGFTGRFWLEILLASGINDEPDDIIALQKAIEKIEPEQIHLNSVARPPLEEFATPLSQERMAEVARRLTKGFTGKVEILVSFAKEIGKNYKPVIQEEIIQMLKRRPCTVHDVCEALNLELRPVHQFLKEFNKSGQLKEIIHDGKRYYQVGRNYEADENDLMSAYRN